MEPADNPGTDPDDRDPREAELSRRSREPSFSLWMVILILMILGATVYVVSAVI